MAKKKKQTETTSSDDYAIDPSYAEEEEYAEPPVEGEEEQEVPEGVDDESIPEEAPAVEEKETDTLSSEEDDPLATDDALGELFNQRLDDDGNLPPFLDGLFADVPDRNVANARDIFYKSTGASKSDDYKNFVRSLTKEAQKGTAEEELGVFSALIQGSYKQANLGIRALNNSINSNIPEIELVKSAEDDDLVNIVGASGGLIVGSMLVPVAVRGATALAFGTTPVGWALWGAIAAGQIGFSYVHSYVSSFDDPKNRELYDSLFASLVTEEGLFTKTAGDLSREEAEYLMFLAQSLDNTATYALFKTAMPAVKGGIKIGSATWNKVFRVTPKKQFLEQAGFANAINAGDGKRALMRKANNQRTADTLTSMTDNELDDIQKMRSHNFDKYIGNLRDVDTNPDILSALHHRRRLLNIAQGTDMLASANQVSKAAIQKARSFLKKGRKSPTVQVKADYAASAGRALKNIKKGGGHLETQVDDYIDNLALEMETVPQENIKAVPGFGRKEVREAVEKSDPEETFIKGMKYTGSSFDSVMEASDILFKKLMTETKKIAPNQSLVTKLEGAMDLTHVRGAYMGRKGGATLNKFQYYGTTVEDLGRLKKNILHHLTRAKALQGKAAVKESNRANKLIKDYNAINKNLTQVKEDFPSQALSLAVRAKVNNSLGYAALLTAMSSTVFASAYQGWYYMINRSLRGQNPFAVFDTFQHAKKVMKTRLRERYLTKKDGSSSRMNGRGWFVQKSGSKVFKQNQKIRSGNLLMPCPVHP